MNETYKSIKNLLKNKSNILLLTHTKMDGDALGSTLATYIFLKKFDKEVAAISNEPVPHTFQFLPTTEVISTEFMGKQDFIVTINCNDKEIDKMRYTVEDNKVNILITPKEDNFSKEDICFHKSKPKYDLIITLDTPSIEQLGKIYEDNVDTFFEIPIINIDHHSSNTHFGQINLVDTKAASTTEILFDLFKFLQGKDTHIDKNIATLLLAGIITDTGSFQNANTTPKSLEIAADLFDLGANQQDIIKNIYKTKKLSTLKLWGKVLSKLKNDPIHRIVWSLITSQDIEETNSNEDDTNGIIDELMSNTPGAEIFLLIKERSDGKVSGSIRTISPHINAAKIAGLFHNGGGHTQAAGFKIDKNDEDIHIISGKIIDRIKNFQKERLGLKKENNNDIKEISLDIKENTENNTIIDILAKLKEK